MAQTLYTIEYKHDLNPRERLIILEINQDSIDTASSFVDYIAESYGFSKSSVWYNLKSLKAAGMIEFADRAHIGDPLKLTRAGMQALYSIEKERKKPSSDMNAHSGDGFAVVPVAVGLKGSAGYAIR